jgi:hypothetical protein
MLTKLVLGKYYQIINIFCKIWHKASLYANYSLAQRPHILLHIGKEQVLILMVDIFRKKCYGI